MLSRYSVTCSFESVASEPAGAEEKIRTRGDDPVRINPYLGPVPLYSFRGALGIWLDRANGYIHGTVRQLRSHPTPPAALTCVALEPETDADKVGALQGRVNATAAIKLLEREWVGSTSRWMTWGRLF